MPGKKIDGKGFALKMRAELAERVAVISEKLGRPPGLAVVLVGEDPRPRSMYATKSWRPPKRA